MYDIICFLEHNFACLHDDQYIGHISISHANISCSDLNLSVNYMTHVQCIHRVEFIILCTFTGQSVDIVYNLY